MNQARLFRIEGRVQGVGFRWFAERTAQELKLAGYVKNLYDDSVEVYAIGPERQLEELRARLEKGPIGAQVTRVIENPAALRKYNGFHLEY